MSLKVQQIFVRHDDQKVVANMLREYVTINLNNFVPHHRYSLLGHQQILAKLIKNKRQFLLYRESDWVVIWEIVEYVEFADPAIASFLSGTFKTDAVWLTLDSDYDIWAYQYYKANGLVEEQFTPESYFLDGELSPRPLNKMDCIEIAEQFNSRLHLPAFLVSLPRLERESKRFPNVTKIICHFTSRTNRKRKA